MINTNHHAIKEKWLYYTALVGLLPFITRFLVSLFVSTSDLSFAFQAVDFVTFGLVLCISNINILEHYDTTNRGWKTQSLAVSVFFIFIFSLIFGFSLLTNLGFENLKPTVITTTAIVLSLVMFFYSYSIYDWISKSVEN